jgi:hypothetical protein
VQVIDGHERQVARPGERLSGGNADEQRSDEARPLRNRHALHITEPGVCLVERFPEYRKDQLEVVTGRDLGDDSAVLGVELGLRRDDIREQPPILRDERRRRLVTRRLNPENHSMGETVFPP